MLKSSLLVTYDSLSGSSGFCEECVCWHVAHTLVDEAVLSGLFSKEEMKVRGRRTWGSNGRKKWNLGWICSRYTVCMYEVVK